MLPDIRGLGGRMKAARRYLGLSRVQLARRLAITPNMLKRYENGSRRPSIDLGGFYPRLVPCSWWWWETGLGEPPAWLAQVDHINAAGVVHQRPKPSPRPRGYVAQS